MHGRCTRMLEAAAPHYFSILCLRWCPPCSKTQVAQRTNTVKTNHVSPPVTQEMCQGCRSDRRRGGRTSATVWAASSMKVPASAHAYAPSSASHDTYTSEMAMAVASARALATTYTSASAKLSGPHVIAAAAAPACRCLDEQQGTKSLGKKTVSP